LKTCEVPTIGEEKTRGEQGFCGTMRRVLRKSLVVLREVLREGDLQPQCDRDLRHAVRLAMLRDCWRFVYSGSRLVEACGGSPLVIVTIVKMQREEKMKVHREEETLK